MIAAIRFFILLVFVAVALSYVLRLYEWRNLTPRERGDAEERLAPSFTALVAVFWEFLATLWTLVLLPLGWFENDPEEPIETDERPIVFIPGLTTNRASFWTFKRYFRQKGHGAIFTLNLGPFSGSIRQFINLVAERVDDVRAQTGAEKVDLVCFGIGGLVARMYLKNGGASKVAHCVTVGTAHEGTRMSALLGGRANRETMINRPLMQELAAGLQEELAAGPRFINVFSTFDNVVLPPTQGVLPGAENYRLDYLGHTALLHSKQVHQICWGALRGVPAEGHPHHYFAEFPNE